jgi:succinyl-diaminopimelate desuccinylase
MTLSLDKSKLIDIVEKDKDFLIDFLRGFLRAPSPNPPGDTRIAAKYITDFLDSKKIDYIVVGPDSDKPNIVSSFNAPTVGRHLILNGHIDVFPVGTPEGWNRDPWGGELVNNRIFGRGACDMKAGTTALLYTYVVLHEFIDELKGSLTFTAVSDEETGGRLGAGWLVNNLPETIGDCCINAEPSSPYTIRFGEKGILWIKVKIRSKGGHGAYTHLSKNPIKIAARLITDVENLTETPINYPQDLRKAIDEGYYEAERALGSGGAEVMKKLSLNIGNIDGGVKVNVIPRECSFELDLRLPPGMGKEDVIPRLEEIIGRYPEASYEELRYDGPLWSPPDGEMAQILRSNSKLFGIDPKPIVSLGGSDLKFWRALGIPSYYYGPTNHGMGTVDEYVEVDEFMHVVKVHLLSVYDYLAK